MSSFSSNAILAKVRSMYSKHLSESDYDELLKRRTISDLTAYLKNETAYGEILSQVKETNIHREQLEALLNEEAFMRLAKLMRYASKKDLEFYRLGILELEMHLIMIKIRLMEAQSTLSYDLKIPDYLVRYASFHLYGLLSVNTYDELLRLIRSTEYYHIFESFRSKDGEKINLNLLERALRREHYSEYIRIIKKLFKGKKQKDLLTMIYTVIELQNITKIYRLKKYFNAPSEDIKNTLLLEYSRIPLSVLNEMIEAKDATEFLNMLAASPYKLYVDDNDFVFIEYYTGNIKYHLAKRFMRFSTDSPLVYMTYKFVQSIEIDNLKHIIEGLRYGQSADKIEDMLIY